MIRSGMTSLALWLVPSLAALTFTASVDAAIIRYEFSGTITTGDRSTGVAVGDRFTGTLVYNSSATLEHALKNSAGELTGGSTYSGTHREGEPTADGTGLQLLVNGRSIAPSSTGVTTNYNVFGAGETAASYLTVSGHAGSSIASNLWMSFEGRGVDVFSGGKIPAGLTLADVSRITIALEDLSSPASSIKVFGAIDSFVGTQVPEPAWTVAALLGASLWVVRRRKAA